MQKYREVNKAPVFSHDELLIAIATAETSQKISRILLPLFEEMVNRELARRQLARSSIARLQEVEEDLHTRPDEYYHCVVDKSYCFLSQIVTEGHEAVSCAEHHDRLPAGSRTMKIRYTDARLSTMLATVRKQAGVSEQGPSQPSDPDSVRAFGPKFCPR